ncbi:MAG: hypothetical protein WDZ45_00010 [Flavobacteriaceae bacterium]
MKPQNKYLKRTQVSERKFKELLKYFAILANHTDSVQVVSKAFYLLSFGNRNEFLFHSFN